MARYCMIAAAYRIHNNDFITLSIIFENKKMLSFRFKFNMVYLCVLCLFFGKMNNTKNKSVGTRRESVGMIVETLTKGTIIFE